MMIYSFCIENESENGGDENKLIAELRSPAISSWVNTRYLPCLKIHDIEKKLEHCSRKIFRWKMYTALG